MVVYLAYTSHDRDGWRTEPTLMRVYKKSSYQKAYDWLAEIAERHGNAAAPEQKPFPVPGSEKVALQVISPTTLQMWWIERHDAE